MTDKRNVSVRLRAIEPEDLDVLYKIENDFKLWGVGVTNVPYSRYMLHDYIAHASGDIYSDKQVRMMIENQDGQTIGIVDITDFEPRHMRAEMGIVIQCQYRNSGYATATIREAMRYAKDILHLHQMYVYIDLNNQVAVDLFRKEGFLANAPLKDWLFDGTNYRDALLMQYFL